MIEFLVVVVVVQPIIFLLMIMKLKNDMFHTIERQEKEWFSERKHLMDRLQAPSFDHLKHQEAKIIKAQNEQPKEVVTLEVV